MQPSGEAAQRNLPGPDSDVLWLTGLTTPDCVVIIRNPPLNEWDNPSDSLEECHVFLPHADSKREAWFGKMTGLEGALKQCGPDTIVQPLLALAHVLPDLLIGCPRLIYWPGAIPRLDNMLLEAVTTARRQWKGGLLGPSSMEHPHDFTGKLRGPKSKVEIQAISRAINLTCQAMKQALIEHARPGNTENMVKAAIQNVFTAAGGSEAFPSIVATGKNSTILHYEGPGTARLQAGNLLLMDIGARLDGYCGDVTRTFPVDGKFSAPQAELYNLVLQAQKAVIATIAPGTTLQDIHQTAVQVLTEGMIRLGLLKGVPEARIIDNSYKSFYPHYTSHFLGIDVHDTTPGLDAHGFVKLQPGMIITVEPGIYISTHAAESIYPPPPVRYRNIGIRIEHDVLVTETGCQILSDAIPVEIEEVEEMTSLALQGKKR